MKLDLFVKLTSARSPIAFDAVRRKDVRRSREVVAGETRWSRRGARSLRFRVRDRVGKGWEVVLEYGIGGRTWGAKTSKFGYQTSEP